MQVRSIEHHLREIMLGEAEIVWQTDGRVNADRSHSEEACCSAVFAGFARDIRSLLADSTNGVT
jgi:hypothetical protein